ncbi:hypothetical protein EMCRGX_G017974 [Ephydatia muelleri]|eukprot:Em0012g421a
MAQSVITQVTRDADSYTPCPPPVSVQERAGARNPERSSKPEKMCLCNWILACFKKDEPAVGSAPFSSDSSSSPPTPELGADKYLLPALEPGHEDRKCVIIDLDETLVHSSFKPVNNADFIVPVEIDNVVHQVYVLKRPYCDEFLKRMGEMFECVLFTASLAKYADPVANLLDKYNAFSARLFRESCVFHRGNYVKDLSRLGRDLTKVVIIDNSPQSYIFHPNNAVPVTSWFEDRNDTELLDLIPFFEALDKEDNVVTALSRYHQFQTTPIPMEIETPLATAQRSS